VIRSFFKIVNVISSHTLSANPTNFPGLSVVSADFETGNKYKTDKNNKK
jgi:hypothetical protein